MRFSRLTRWLKWGVVVGNDAHDVMVPIYVDVYHLSSGQMHRTRARSDNHLELVLTLLESRTAIEGHAALKRSIPAPQQIQARASLSTSGV